jgi:amidase
MSAGVQIVDAGAAEHARRVRAGELSVRKLIAATLARIAAVDPRLNAYRVVFAERALAAADELDRRRSADRALPLLGVPVAVKDDMDVEGEVTALGGPTRMGRRSRRIPRSSPGSGPRAQS